MKKNLQPCANSVYHCAPFFIDLDLNLNDLNPNTWAVTPPPVSLLLHRPLSPIFQTHWLVSPRPKMTHIDLPPALFTLCDNSCATKPPPPFFLFLFPKNCATTTYVKDLQQCCESVKACVYVPFTSRPKKEKQQDQMVVWWVLLFFNWCKSKQK